MKAVFAYNDVWYLEETTKRVGLLFKRANDWFLITDEIKDSAPTIEDLQAKTAITIEFQTPSAEGFDTKTVLGGYPTKHEEHHSVSEIDGIITYTATAASTQRFAAGFFGVLGSKKYTTSECPTLVKLQSNKYIGPFKTKFECDNMCILENRKLGE